MKTKILTLIAIVAFVTVSVAFTSAKRDEKKAKSNSEDSRKGNEPAGGFVIEDKL